MLPAAFPRPAEDADTCAALGHGAPALAQEPVSQELTWPALARSQGLPRQQGPRRAALGQCPVQGWEHRPGSQTGAEHRAGGSRGALAWIRDALSTTMPDRSPQVQLCVPLLPRVVHPTACLSLI